ncbi:hypothetical protein CEUSTIGMA_g3963.t1 [Chlamydomonas eustigma]|uniref:CP12 domain-containing protein n=1 Tax=Chlamydomonas eustigma TaxID=1157962 RepID=A0A250X0B9_9CHLO|nr:hypothetical protein CEUSTIGMA_g3963.t1 [Chlamydomonas eustigma]|eukprot:GAX76517.1 hypothetical protein CEUSTIGMA_g3963.t1 [Chlamydomonas eustigma]
MASLMIRSNVLSRPSLTVGRARVSQRSLIAVRAQPETKKIMTAADAIKEAEEACKDGSTEACAAAWDVVEEVAATAAHKKIADKEKSDPLEQFCEGNPDADECRVYE